MDKKVSVGGLELKNPVILASAGYTSSAAGLKKQIPKGYGAVITKTVTMQPLKGAPKPSVFWYDPDEKRMLSGAEALKNPGIEKMAEAVREVKDLAVQEDCKIIGSLTENELEDIVHIAKEFDRAGVDAIELNMACPSTGPYLGESYAKLAQWWTQDVEKAVLKINSVKEAVSVPVWAKIHVDRLLDYEFL